MRVPPLLGEGGEAFAFGLINIFVHDVRVSAYLFERIVVGLRWFAKIMVIRTGRFFA